MNWHNIKYLIKSAFFLLFKAKNCGWYLIAVNDKEIENIENGKDYQFELFYGKMPEFIFFRTIKDIGSQVDDIDLILKKAIYQAENELNLKSKKHANQNL